MDPDPLISFRRKPADLNIGELQRFAEALRSRIARGREFHCRMTTDAELRELNARFRGKDYATDVLSFPHDSGDTLGDIAISVPRARAQSRTYRLTVEEELKILMLHGVLHLIGMDHESDSGEMRRAEIRWRKKLELPAGLIERGEA